MPTDYKNVWKQLYSPPPDSVTVVEAPPMLFLMADGSGDPNSAAAYAAAVGALYAVAYGLKFALMRRDAANDYRVMPLEGLWWADPIDAFLAGRRQDWRWTMMISQPVEPPPELLAAVIADVARKKTDAARMVRLERYHEGRAAQILHIGPYAAEGPTIARLHEFIASHGWRLAGTHHEIYLSDPNRTAPEKMRTVLRQPYAHGE
jgi:hypothetical protein